MTTKEQEAHRSLLPIDMQCKRRIDQMRLIQKGVINTKQPKQHVKKAEIIGSVVVLILFYHDNIIAYIFVD